MYPYVALCGPLRSRPGADLKMPDEQAFASDRLVLHAIEKRVNFNLVCCRYAEALHFWEQCLSEIRHQAQHGRTARSSTKQGFEPHRRRVQPSLDEGCMQL